MIVKKKKKVKRKNPGPKPDILQIEGDWQDAVKTALTKRLPKKS
jgi:hypothetical protein